MKRPFFWFAVLALLLLETPSSLAQHKAAFAPDKMDTVLYGAAYYTEYMPYDRLEQDVQLMQQAGISVVRLGESSRGGRAYTEVSRTAHELQRIGPDIVDLKHSNKVAILYSRDSYYGIEFMKFSDKVNYRTMLGQMYDTFYRLNCGVDFVFPESTNLANYKVIVVPPLYVAGDELLNRLAEYMFAGRQPDNGLQERIHQ
jgi:beta-galactosidase GanA